MAFLTRHCIHVTIIFIYLLSIGSSNESFELNVGIYFMILIPTLIWVCRNLQKFSFESLFFSYVYLTALMGVTKRLSEFHITDIKFFAVSYIIILSTYIILIIKVWKQKL